MSRLFFAYLILLIVALTGCDVSEPSAVPLRPLVYTEHTIDEPAAASVREERLLTEMLSLDRLKRSDAELLTKPKTPNELGERAFDALCSQNVEAWRALFADREPFSLAFAIDRETAQRKIDSAVGASRIVWNRFSAPPPANIRSGGMCAAFAFQRFDVGSESETELPGVTIANDAKLVFGLTDTVLTFAIPIPILIDVRRGYETMISGPAVMDSSFESALTNGLHLRRDLSRADTYPYPLAVGNLWRYRVSEGQRQSGAVDKFERGLAGGDSPTEMTLELVGIERFGVIRIVTFKKIYNRGEQLSVDEHWLVTPITAYICDAFCFENRDKLENLMPYFASRSPIFSNPLVDDSTFKIGTPISIETPAGRFESVVPIEGSGDLGVYDIALAVPQTRYFKPGRGVVLRELHLTTPTFHELIEIRLLPP